MFSNQNLMWPALLFQKLDYNQQVLQNQPTGGLEPRKRQKNGKKSGYRILLVLYIFKLFVRSFMLGYTPTVHGAMLNEDHLRAGFHMRKRRSLSLPGLNGTTPYAHFYSSLKISESIQRVFRILCTKLGLNDATEVTFSDFDPFWHSFYKR